MTFTTSILGLDVGGANLKAAHVAGSARLQPFALWKNPEQLAPALRELLHTLPHFDSLALTMTGELCDCFATKRQGVHAILDAVVAAARGRPIQVWRTDGRLVDVAAARDTPLLTAAANWLALATYVVRFVEGPGLLLDIGSTTADIVPLSGGRPIPRGLTDTARLRCGELVYTGVRRTPLCALLRCPAAAEFFATTLDAYLVLGDLPEEDAMDTADGRAATRPLAHARLARMLCGDADTCTPEETCELARQAVGQQIALLRQALRRVLGTLGTPPRTVVLAGSGEFLARKVLEEEKLHNANVVSLAERLGPELSNTACAYAVAVLAAEKCDAVERRQGGR